MVTEKTSLTKEDIKSLKFHTKNLIDHVEYIDTYHKSFDAEKLAINTFWFNKHCWKDIVEFFDFYEELEKNLEKIKEEAEAKQQEFEERIEELEDEVEMEHEEIKKILIVGEKWSKNQAEDIKEKTRNSKVPMKRLLT